ncbi:riboflavin synthase [Candidatus Kaiserbacteria bacterium]|nr:riboflavin synthase [Candidatus Kaiserbacteria bacterium]
MFSGIIQAKVRVEKASERGKNLVVRIRAPRGWRIRPGDSISVDGVCSTAAKVSKNFIEFDYMPETLALTTVSGFIQGTEVNLERSMKYGDRVDGHFVAGHVDARGEVVSVRNGVLTVRIPQALSRLVAIKGSIAVNGVALTVTARTTKSFSVALIPYTLAHTNLGKLKEGHVVNVEVDLLARYLDALMKKR